ncbi:hypothetical protein BB560_004900, partial [Smittium megazygosporum]
IWKLWIKAETTNLFSVEHTCEQVKYILNLYDQAIEEFLDVDLYLDYFKFIDSIDERIWCEVFQLNETEKEIWIKEWKSMQWDRAIQATQYHFTKSHVIWNFLFEKKQALIETVLDSDLKQSLTQESHKLLLDRLSIPHQQLDETFSIYSMFVTKYMIESYEDIMVQVNSVKFNTQKRCSLRETHERKLLDAVSFNLQGDELFNIWMSYLSSILFENSQQQAINFGNSNEILTLFERILIPLFNYPSVWSYYLSIALKLSVGEEKLTSIISRATKNCPWSGQIQSLKMITGFSDPNELFEQILRSKALDHNGNEMLTFIFSRINVAKMAYINKNISADEMSQICKNVLASYLKKFPRTIDYEFKLQKFISRTELLVNNNENNAFEIWEKTPNFFKKTHYYWLSFAEFATGFSFVDKARAIFSSSLPFIVKTIKSSDDAVNEQLYLYSQEMFDAFLNFETQFGNFQTTLEAAFEIQQCRNRIRSCIVSKSIKTSANTELLNKPETEQNPFDSNSVFKRNREAESSINSMNDSNSSEKKFKSISDADMEASDSKTKLTDEKYTVCVDSLAPNVDKAQLENIFSKIGLIRDLRFVTKHQSKTYSTYGKTCQITFQTADGVLNSLLKNNTPIVDIGDPKNAFKVKIKLLNDFLPYKKPKVSYYTLFVSNIPPEVTNEELINVFSKYSVSPELILINNSPFQIAFLTNILKPEMESIISNVNGIEIGENKVVPAVFKYNRTLSEHTKFFSYTKENSVYVSNINYSTTLKNLSAFFQELLGTDFFVLEYNLDERGNFLGQAEFTEKALSLHEYELDSRNICITRNNTPQKASDKNSESNNKKSKAGVTSHSTTFSPDQKDLYSTIRVTGFPHKMETSLLRDISSQIGKVGRVHKNQAGNKIFIDMYNHKDADELVKKLDGMFIDNQKIRADHVKDRITFRNEDGTSTKDSSFYSNREKGRSTAFAPRKKMNFVPRSLKRSGENETKNTNSSMGSDGNNDSKNHHKDTAGTNLTEINNAPKSNDYFASLFKKN